MDEKTLEYLEAKVNKARSLMRKINDLKIQLENIDLIHDVFFRHRSGSGLFSLNDENIVAEIKVSLKAILEDEITRLEQEFAEL